MNEQDMMMNNEVMDVAEATPVSSGSGLKAVGGLLLVGGLLYGGYKIIRKLRAKKNEGMVDAVAPEVSDDCDVEDIG